jgi:hypothetical protein
VVRISLTQIARSDLGHVLPVLDAGPGCRKNEQRHSEALRLYRDEAAYQMSKRNEHFKKADESLSIRLHHTQTKAIAQGVR